MFSLKKKRRVFDLKVEWFAKKKTESQPSGKITTARVPAIAARRIARALEHNRRTRWRCSWATCSRGPAGLRWATSTRARGRTGSIATADLWCCGWSLLCSRRRTTDSTRPRWTSVLARRANRTRPPTTFRSSSGRIRSAWAWWHRTTGGRRAWRRLAMELCPRPTAAASWPSRWPTCRWMRSAWRSRWRRICRVPCLAAASRTTTVCRCGLRRPCYQVAVFKRALRRLDLSIPVSSFESGSEFRVRFRVSSPVPSFESGSDLDSEFPVRFRLLRAIPSFAVSFHDYARSRESEVETFYRRARNNYSNRFGVVHCAFARWYQLTT